MTTQQTTPTYPERVLQSAVLKIFSDPARVWKATSGEKLQVVACGTKNVHEGPDFLNMAVLCDGCVSIGDGEFHTKASLFYHHGHDADPRYENLMVHVVFDDDRPEPSIARWTIQINQEELYRYIRRSPTSTLSTIELEEVQQFALLRLLRHTSEAHALVKRIGESRAPQAFVADFCDRLRSKRSRPRTSEIASGVSKAFPNSAMNDLIDTLHEISPSNLLLRMENAESQQIAFEGLTLRREVFINGVLPMLCVKSSLEQRIVLFQWYWTVKSVHHYGRLKRFMPTQSQDLAWQQQGMLEYLRLHGGRKGVCGEIIRLYGLQNTVDFLQASPLP